ncbi:MAG TPA: hypothetical protein H9773_04985 [Candidatus Fournierella merdavium]|nr:hypothetical protein [Candidatus Fournierella merdavium]
MKRIAIIAATCALALSLAGCWNDDKPASGSTKPTPTPAVSSSTSGSTSGSMSGSTSGSMPGSASQSGSLSASEGMGNSAVASGSAG